MNFSNSFNLKINGHRDIDFVDTRLETDTALYIDPERIALSNHPCSPTAVECIDDFFSTLCEAAATQNDFALYKLLSCGREPNETHFGLSSFRSQGRGTSPKILMPIVKSMIQDKLFEDQLVTQFSDLCLWTPNFGFDRLSDLTTNIIRGVLYNYTLQQYQTWGIPISDAGISTSCTWNPETHEWETKEFASLFADERPILLVPKAFVGQAMLSYPGQLLWKLALRYRQSDHLDRRSILCHERVYRNGTHSLIPPAKRDIYLNEKDGRTQKAFLLSLGHQYPSIVNELHSSHRLLSHSTSITMEDYELDKLLYYQESAVV